MLCMPFKQVNGNWTVPTEKMDDCTMLDAAEVKAAYYSYVCPEAVPADAGLTNSAYAVRNFCSWPYAKFVLST
jgi:hypothetical protein